MPFYLRDKLFISSHNSESEVKQELFDAVQAVGMAEEILTETEKNYATLPVPSLLFSYKPSAYCAMQKTYIVLSGAASEHYMGGSDDLDSCIGVAFYDPKCRKLIVVHIDTSIDLTNLEKIFDELKDADTIEVRFFGGVQVNINDNNQEQGGTVSSQQFESKPLAEKLYFYLYQKATISNLKINILSDNTLTKLADYQKSQSEHEETTTASFVINARTGKVQLYFHSHQKKWLPYNTIEAKGLYSGIYKNNSLYIKFHNSLNFKSDELIKIIDTTDPIFNEEYLRDVEQRCRDYTLGMLYNNSLRKLSFIASDDDKVHLHNQIEEWFKRVFFSKTKDFTKAVLDYTLAKIVEAPHGKKLPLPFKLHDTFLYKALAEIEFSIKKMVSTEKIVELLLPQEIKNVQLIQAFSNVNGIIHLIDELKKQNQETGLVHDLLNLDEGQTYESVLQEWQNKIVDKEVKRIARVMINHIISECEDNDIDLTQLESILVQKMQANVERINLDAIYISNDSIRERAKEACSPVIDEINAALNQYSCFQDCLPSLSSKLNGELHQSFIDYIDLLCQETLYPDFGFQAEQENSNENSSLITFQQ